MGIFFKRGGSKQQKSLFSEIFFDKNGKLKEAIGYLAQMVYSDLDFQSLHDSSHVDKQFWRDADMSFFPDTSYFSRVPTNINLISSGKLTQIEGSGDFREQCSQIIDSIDKGLAFEVGAALGSKIPGNRQFAVQNFEFYKDSKSREYLYSSVIVGAWGFQFDPDFHGPKPPRGVQSEEPISGKFLVADYVKSVMTEPLAIFFAASEILTRLYGVDNSEQALEDMFSNGRSFNMPKSSYPQPTFRYINAFSYLYSDAGAGQWSFVPDALEVGWLFSQEALEDERARNLLTMGLPILTQLIAEALEFHGPFMDAHFGQRYDLRYGKDESISRFVPIGKLSEFYEKIEYHPDGNTLAYSFLLPRLAEGKLAVDYVVDSLEEYIEIISQRYPPKDEFLEFEKITALGNLAIAFLISGDLEKSSQYIRKVLNDDPSDSEAHFIAREILKIKENETLRSALDNASRKETIEVYDAPHWLLVAINALHTLGDKSSDESSVEPKIDSNLLENLVLQFVEFKSLAKKFEYITFRDAQGLRPDIELTHLNDDQIVLSLIGAEESPVSEHYPWLESYYEEPQLFQYSIPNRYLVDSVGLRRFLSVIFETYQDIELELVPIGTSRPKIRTFFPVTKRVTGPSILESNKSKGTSHNSTPRAFFGFTRELGDESPIDFDWF
jgi:tetratricopeptide (TPR) repeat protein